MPYLGTKGLKASDIRRFNVTGSTSATHTLTWVAPTEQSLIVTINGVKQQEDAYSVSGTTLTLTSALVVTDKMEVVGINDVGTTVTPAQNSVNLDKLATTGTPSSSTFLRGDMAWTAVSDTSGLSSVQTFTSSGTWTRPSGITKVVVEVQGGGGGGGGGDNYGSQGGGGGGYAKKLIDVSSISSSTITVGAFGAAGINISNGSAGGDSIWSDGTNTVTGSGGGGGKANNGAWSTLLENQGAATGGDLNIAGQIGRMGITNEQPRAGGHGGSSILGHGGSPIAYGGVPNLDQATGYGSGGAGGSASGITNNDGAPGKVGIVIVTEYK
jgi:hypothetical protein